jgi:hypothetical protein
MKKSFLPGETESSLATRTVETRWFAFGGLEWFLSSSVQILYTSTNALSPARRLPCSAFPHALTAMLLQQLLYPLVLLSPSHCIFYFNQWRTSMRTRPPPVRRCNLLALLHSSTKEHTNNQEAGQVNESCSIFPCHWCYSRLRLRWWLLVLLLLLRGSLRWILVPDPCFRMLGNSHTNICHNRSASLYLGCMKLLIFYFYRHYYRNYGLRMIVSTPH